MFSAALLYYDYVGVPGRTGTGGGVKTCFPEDIPRAGLPGQKPEQAGREPEVSAIDLRSLQSKYLNVRGWLTIPESGIDYPVLQSNVEDPEYYLRRDCRETTTSMEVCPPGRLYSGRIRESDHLRSQHEQRCNVRESDQYVSYDYWKAHPKVFSDTGRHGRIPDSGSLESRCVHV